jgi:hypothetical protein
MKMLALSGHGGRGKSGGNTAALQKLREIEGALVVQQGQVAEDIGFDLGRLGFGIDLLQLVDDLLHGVLAIAALHNFEARAVEAQRTFGHQEKAVLIVFAEAASGSQLRVRLKVRSHGRSWRGTKAPGGGQPGFT